MFPDILRNQLLVSPLTSIICESCMNNSYQNEWKINTELLTKQLTILKVFLDAKQDFELEALYAVQLLDFKYNHPTGECFECTEESTKKISQTGN